ncbi:CPBP family intramembrane glutamic endopeptidase [Acetobacter fallax]|uniref:CPBP family intramembrane metalloprotease n=1 Tax=Acetobacter fallax TaxID=1737473 RepID=A0ABX0KE30_9PROT|nr:type II CAAX endopeptidase family protein [Acetobacter fallax]NHO33356.1 CPBP family intramembrane metalloprotease [Acetobacter fallax]NHO36976.1 CPBP family intramembrane metalloprotease [Acetobacter fallax]
MIPPISAFPFAAAQGRTRASSLGRSALYIVLVLVCGLLVSALSGILPEKTVHPTVETSLIAAAVSASLFLLCFVVFPTRIMLRLFRDPPEQAGWQPANAPQLLFLGISAGFVAITLFATVLWSEGAVRWTPAIPTLRQVVSEGLLSAVFWLCVAASEEGLNRGYAFVQLVRAFSFWPAALIDCGIVMLEHATYHEETAAGILGAGLFGLVLVYSFLQTGSLWFALGLHASWKFAQNFIFGFASRDATETPSLLMCQLSDNPLLTGGSAGPEGSILILPVTVLLMALVHGLGLRLKPHASERVIIMKQADACQARFMNEQVFPDPGT